MKRIYTIMALCATSLAPLQAQGVDDVLRSVARQNKAIQALQMSGEAEKTSIEAENCLEDPSVSYSSFYERGSDGQAGSELVVSQGFDFPTVYGRRARAGRVRSEAVDSRAEALRQDVLLEAKLLCLELIRLNQQQDLLVQRMRNADTLLALFETRLAAGDATLIDVNKIKLERMDVQTELLQNHAAHRTALQQLLALNGNAPLTFSATEYPAVPEHVDPDAVVDEALRCDASLRAAEAESQAADQAVGIGRQQWLPRLEIGYRRNTSMDAKQHGFVVGGSLPLFSNRKQVRVARAEAVATRLTASDARLKAEASLHAGLNEMRQSLRALDVYDRDLMVQTLGMLEESVKGGEMSVADYFVEADPIYRNLQARMDLECQYQKAAAAVYKYKLGAESF